MNTFTCELLEIKSVKLNKNYKKGVGLSSRKFLEMQSSRVQKPTQKSIKRSRGKN